MTRSIRFRPNACAEQVPSNSWPSAAPRRSTGAWGPMYFAPMELTGGRSESVMRTSALENRSGAIASCILGGDGEAEGEAGVLTIM